MLRCDEVRVQGGRWRWELPMTGCSSSSSRVVSARASRRVPSSLCAPHPQHFSLAATLKSHHDGPQLHQPSSHRGHGQHATLQNTAAAARRETLEAGGAAGAPMILHRMLAAAVEAAAGGVAAAAAGGGGATGAAHTLAAAAASAAPAAPGIWWPLLLSTFAGLSTSLGALIAINLAPNEATLAFLLGSAIGVMGTVSVAELWVHKAIEHSNWVGVTAALLVGAAVFALLDPLLPKSLGEGGQHALQDGGGGARGGGQQQTDGGCVVSVDSEPLVTVATSVKRQTFAPRQAGLKAGVSPGGDSTSGAAHRTSFSGAVTSGAAAPAALAGSSGGKGEPPGSHQQQQQQLSPRGLAAAAADAANDCDCSSVDDQSSSGRLLGGGHAPSCSGGRDAQAQLQLLRAHHAGLMRLGLLMALTMTLHNMPEGFAVAFSALREGNRGPVMALAIAAHNIPEGLVIAAPIWAATGSKTRALAVATASGLSEPLGAVLALAVARPFVTSTEALDLLLAFVGGIMLAVCALELWPEGRKCRQDGRMAQGILLGSVLMGWTLYAGV